MTRLQGRGIHKGTAEGEALVTAMPISFFGGVDPDTGVVVERDHELEGQSIAGKVLAFPFGRGSTVGSYIVYRLKKAGTAPAAIVNRDTEAIVAVGCIIADVPCVDQVDIDHIPAGARAVVDGAAGTVDVRED